MEIDLKKLNENELIQICIDKGITYQNLKTKKPYAKTTLISYIKKFNNDNKKEEIKEEEIIIDYKNEIIWKLTDEEKKSNDEYNEIEAKLISCIKSCHDILYSNGSITGLKASNDIIKIIICRLFNVIYKKEEIRKIISSKISKEDIEKYEKYLIDIREFTKINDREIYNQIQLFIIKIFVCIFPNIFTKDDVNFNTRNNSTNFTKIINKICDLINIDTDDYHLFINLFAETGGNMYEYFTNSYGKGSTSKELGQFFTPFKLINLILYNIKDFIDINDDYTLYDPCCGSGGLLNRTASFLKINRNNIYGCEIESDTTKYALASLLVNNNSLKINILNKCSLTNNNYLFEDNKFDLILTNPPFGIKMTYKDLETRFNDYKTNYYKSSQLKFQDIYPINTNNGACLFIQHVIYMLNEGGICGIVLPDGNELTSKSYYNIRKFLIDNCKIIKVINVSGGTFGSTGVKTKVIIFKKQKGIDNHKNIDFLEINKNCDELKLITTTDLDKNYSFRLKVNQEFILKDDYEIKTLGEICEIIKGPKKRSKDAKEKGLYPLYYCSIIGNLYLDTFDYTDEGIIINKTNGSGKTMIYYGSKNYNVGETTIHFKSKLSNIKTKYIYYYLLYNKSLLEQYYYGLNQQSITDDDLFKIEIPIPSIEIQNKKVEEIDKLETSIETIKLRTEQIKNEQTYILNSILSPEFNDIDIIEFGKMFDLIKGSIQSSKVVEDINGDGLMITQSKNKDDYKKIKNWIIDGNNLFVGNIDSGKKFVVSFYKGKCDYTNLLSLCKLKEDFNDKINNKYIYYYLKSIIIILTEKYLKGLANKKLDVEEFNLMKIPIPSIEKQKEIVDILDGINNRISEDIKYIEVLRKLISKSI
jgi:type I restriction-modification system DNA methylase subunit/restriction endonuclease S subunit